MKPITRCSATESAIEYARRLARLVSVLAAAGVTACGGGTGIPDPEAIGRVDATNLQTAPVGARLGNALAVSVSLADGSPAPRGEVRWTVAEGVGAALSDSVTQANGLGRAEVVLTLGPSPGTYQVRAELRANRSKAVSLTATAVPPPSIVSVTPVSFSASDVVTIRGARLSDSAEIHIGGVPALRSGGSPDSVVSVVVPPCVPPGNADVVAIQQGARSNTLSGTYVASAGLTMVIGDVRILRPEDVANCVTLPPAGVDTAIYLLMPQSVSSTPSDSVRFILRGNLATSVTAAPAARQEVGVPFAVQFHDRLRMRDQEHALLPKPDIPMETAPAVAAAVEVGSKRKFRVCSNLNCTTVEDFPEVSAVAVYVGTHAIIYRDVKSPEGGFSDADYADLGALFDLDLYEVAGTAFGAESDIDRNGRTVILMTPAVNGLTPSSECSSSIITGFFFSIDIDPAFSKDQRSNKAEVFYSMTADPTGQFGCSVGKTQVRQWVPVTFVHELQHMISYNQHVLVRESGTEQLWLNEALSHVAEDLAALRFLAASRSDEATRFMVGNLLNSYRFLSAPDQHALVFRNSPGTLEERGAAWLFARWLLDVYGENFTRRLVETSLVGVGNVENVTRDSFDRLAPEWFTTNFVSDLYPFTDYTSRRLRYRTWDLRASYKALHESKPQQYPRKFPAVPATSVGGVFLFGGTLFPGSGHYYLVRLAPGQNGVVIEFVGPDGEPLATQGRPRLTIARLG